MFNTLWLLIFTLPAVEQYLPTFRFHVKDDDVRTSHQDKNDMFEEAEMFSHQLAFGVVAKPHLSIGVSVALRVCGVSKSSVDLMKFHKHC